MPGHRMVQLLDLNVFRSMKDGSLRSITDEKETDRGTQCYFTTPYDAPFYVRFWRRLKVRQEGQSYSADHLGTTMEIDLYTFGVKLYVKATRPTGRSGTGKLSIILEDGDGFTTVASYDGDPDE